MCATSDQLYEILEEMKCRLSTCPDGRPLHHEGGPGSVADVLSKYRIDVNSTNDKGDTLLTIALGSCDSAQVIRELLSVGVNAMTRDRVGRTPLHCLLNYREPDIISVRWLLHYKADVNAKDRELKTPLHYVLQLNNCIVEIVELLLKHGADVTAKDSKHCTPLLCYIRYQDVVDIKIVKLLLNYKSAINVKDNGFHTPLHCYLKKEYCIDEVVELLLQYGADVTAIDSKYRTPLLCYIRFQWEPKIETLRLLLHYKSDVNAKSQTLETPLHTLLKNTNCKLELVKLLLEYGADVTAEDDDQCTPLLCYFRFMDQQEIETVRLLLNYKSDVNAKDRKFQTPLHYYLENSDYIIGVEAEVVELLIKRGADVKAKNSQNLTCIDNGLLWGNDIGATLVINYALINKYERNWRDIIDIEASRINRHYAHIETHINLCVGEIDDMKTHRVNDKFSLYDWYCFVNRGLVPEPLYSKEMISEDAISKRYPVYGGTLWTVLGPCLDRAVLLKELEELRSIDVCSKLGAECLSKIVEYVPNNDLLNFISALRQPVPG